MSRTRSCCRSRTMAWGPRTRPRSSASWAAATAWSGCASAWSCTAGCCRQGAARAAASRCACACPRARWCRHEHPRPARRRPGADTRRLPDDPRGRGGHRGRGRVRRRHAGARQRQALLAGRGADGHPDARDGRHRGHAANRRRGRRCGREGADADHLRPRRVRLRRAARRRERLSPEGRAGRSARGRDPAGGSGRSPAGAVRHATAHRGVLALPARPQRAPGRGRRADAARGRGVPAAGTRDVERGDRGPADRLRDDREDPRGADPDEARGARPGAGRGARLRVGCGGTGGRVVSAAVSKMRREGLPETAVETFAHYERLLREGDQGTLPESELEPVSDLPNADSLPSGDGAPLDRAVVLKLNGGLGTSMGMTKAKSLLEVKEGLSFLDVIVRQILWLREKRGARVPLLLMNSFATRDDTLAALERYPELAVDDLPLDFLQGRVPKLLEDTHEPVSWPADPALEWAPPGHGDVFTSLAGTGLLDQLLERGYRYMFISNSDNLGAVLDTRILDWFAGEGLPFLSELTDRTEGDRKGGHLARRRSDGGLVLRETAQTPDEDREAFEDVSRHRFFNCNNVWVDLRALERTLDERGHVLGLPMIVNRKTVDPTDPSSPAVVQLETAMGAAIGVFDGAGAVHVPRGRFAPVKTTSHLLVVRSDAYELAEDWTVRLAPGRDAAPIVELSDEFKMMA